MIESKIFLFNTIYFMYHMNLESFFFLYNIKYGKINFSRFNFLEVVLYFIFTF